MKNQEIDIICLSLSRSDSSISSSSLSLAKEFSKSNRVFYIDHPFSVKDFFDGSLKASISKRKSSLLFNRNLFSKLDNAPEGLTIVNTPVALPINAIPNGWLYERLLNINNRMVQKTIRKIIRKFQVKQYIFINFYDPFFMNQIPADLKPLASIYYSMDNFAEIPYFQKHGLRLEDRCVRQYDLTLCTSAGLTSMQQKNQSGYFFCQMVSMMLCSILAGPKLWIARENWKILKTKSLDLQEASILEWTLN